MTRRFPRLFTAVLSTLAPVLVLAQAGKDMGPAGQYYQQPHPKFKFLQGPKKGGGEVQFTVAPGGRTIEEKEDYAIAEGGVTIKYQDITVVADKMTLNHRTKDVVGQGHVVLDEGPTRLTADQLFYNLDTKLGTLFHAQGSMEPSLYFTADKAEKVGETRYILTDGIFTSCDLNRPSWSFRVARADVTLDDYAHMQDVQFRASRLPVFWTPRLIWPTKRDRSQGFLIPRVMFSQEFGERLETGYFVPIGDSADVTVSADLNTRGYTGAGIDARYLPSPDVKLGEVSGYTVHDVEEKRQEWKYSVQHAQDNLPGGFRGVVDIEDFSNIDFFRRFDRDPRIHTLSQIYSSAYLTKNRPTYSLNVLMDRRDIFGAVNAVDPFAPPPRQRFEQLPSLQFRLYPNQIAGLPLYLALESSASHLVTNGLFSGPAANYYRADVFPTLSLQIRTPPWFSIRPQISLRDTWYTAALDPNSLQQTGTQAAVDEKFSRKYAQGQVDFIGPSFSRIFNKDIGGFTRFKHVIEPRVRYVYTSNVSDQEKVIRFDTVDSPFLPIVHDSVEYSLTQRLIGREKGTSASSREVASFSLTQSMSLSKPFTSSTGGNFPGSTVTPVNSRFTPVVASLHVNPYQSITLDANTTIDNQTHQIDQTSLSANLLGTGTRADKYLSFTWFAVYHTPGQTAGIDTSASQIRLNTGSSVLKDRLRADVQLNFDAKNGTFLEQRYLVGTNASCYGIALEMRRYLVYLPAPTPKLSYGIAVTLKNVGTIGTH